MKLAGALFLGVSYIVLSLIIGEWHPFSKETMYSTFPDSAISFYITDENGKLLPLKVYFNYETQDLAHNYYAIKERLPQNLPDSTAEIIIGKQLLALLQKHALKTPAAGNIQLHSITYFLQNNTLQSENKILASFALYHE